MKQIIILTMCALVLVFGACGNSSKRNSRLKNRHQQ